MLLTPRFLKTIYLYNTFDMIKINFTLKCKEHFMSCHFRRDDYLEYKILREVTDTSDNCHRRREYAGIWVTINFSDH